MTRLGYITSWIISVAASALMPFYCYECLKKFKEKVESDAERCKLAIVNEENRQEIQWIIERNLGEIRKSFEGFGA